VLAASGAAGANPRAARERPGEPAEGEEFDVRPGAVERVAGEQPVPRAGLDEDAWTVAVRDTVASAVDCVVARRPAIRPSCWDAGAKRQVVEVRADGGRQERRLGPAGPQLDLELVPAEAVRGDGRGRPASEL